MDWELARKKYDSCIFRVGPVTRLWDNCNNCPPKYHTSMACDEPSKMFFPYTKYDVCANCKEYKQK